MCPSTFKLLLSNQTHHFCINFDTDIPTACIPKSIWMENQYFLALSCFLLSFAYFLLSPYTSISFFQFNQTTPKKSFIQTIVFITLEILAAGIQSWKLTLVLRRNVEKSIFSPLEKTPFTGSM